MHALKAYIFIKFDGKLITQIHQTDKFECKSEVFSPILHTAWLDNHTLTLKSNSANITPFLAYLPKIKGNTSWF
jgi:hypothetical protein